jgi:hypothetical protein
MEMDVRSDIGGRSGWSIMSKEADVGVDFDRRGRQKEPAGTASRV